MTRSLLAAVAALGCGHPPAGPSPRGAGAPQAIDAGPVAVDAPPPLAEDLPRLAARAVELYEAIARGFAAAGEDCARATATLRELAARYADVIAANQQVIRDGRGTQLKLALRPYDARFDAAARAVVQGPTMAACARDPGFATAFDALAGGS